MTSQQQILDVTTALNSNKKKEKLGALEKLTDLLNQERILKTLYKSSKLNDNTINWDIVFIRVHNAVLSVIDENNSKSRQVFDKHQQIIQNVILEVVQKSLHQKAILIDSNLIVSCLLAVFENSFRIKVLGSTYLNIFSKYVMSQKKNWCDLKEEYWIGVKSLCMSQFINPPNGIQRILFLEILIDVIRYSSKSCQISHSFVDLFDFVREIFVSSKKSGYNFEIVLLRLTNTLCLQLAVEFRYKVCEFMESVFDCVINLHEKKKPENNILVYHFLMTALNIHNPNGLWEDKSAYACDLKKWKCQIREIYFLCHEEVRLMLKNPNEVEIGVDFFDLFVYSSHLVSVWGLENVPEVCEFEVSFDEPGPSNKRKCSSDTQTPNTSRSSLGRTKQIKLDGGLKNLTKDLQTPDCWFWLEFLELLLHKFPSDLKNEYCQLVEVLYQLMCGKRDTKNTKAAIRCLCSIVKMESSVEVDLTSDQVQALNDTWNKISLELLRSLQAETYPETHLLMRSLISHGKLRDPGPLIRLYCTGNLQSNLDNFKTLCVTCQNCILPDVLVTDGRSKNCQQNYDNVRVHLLLWLLQGEEKYPCKDLAKALIALILKRFEEEIEKRGVKEDTLISRININDFCKLITNNYMVVAFKNLKLGEESKVLENNSEAKLDGGMIYKLFNLLALRVKCLMDALNNQTINFADQSKTVKDCLWFCELLCHLLSHFEFMSESEEDKLALKKLLEVLLYQSTTKCASLARLKFYDLTPLFRLYDGNFHQNVQKNIRDEGFINLELLKIVFEVFEDRDVRNDGFVGQDNGSDLESISRFSQMIKNPQSILHFGNLTKKEKIVVHSAEFLCQYVAVSGSSDVIHHQSALAKNIIDSLVCDKTLNISSSFHLQLVLRVVYNFTKYDGITISVLNSCLNLTQLIFDSKPTDPEVIITILQVLKDLTLLVHRVGDEDTHSKYMEIIGGFRNVILVKKTCGVKTVSKFIECLAEISKVDLEGNWGVLERKGSTCRAFEEIISFLKHPYHEVRLTAAQNVGLLFAYCKTRESTVPWQREMLTTLFEVLSNNAGLRPKERGCVAEYFDYVISSISLISLANIICLSSYWRKKALFYLLHLAFLKSFRKSEVEDIIKLICKELKIRDVSSYISPSFFYLFYKWADKELQIQDFPYYLFGCQTVDDFLQNHFPTLVTAYAQMGKIEMISTISTKLNKPVNEILKHCHSLLISYVLPNLNENANCETAKKAQALKRFINRELTSKTSIRLLTLSLDEVIFHMIRNMHDPGYLKTLIGDFVGNVEDDRGPGCCSASQVVETLENLSTNEGQYLLGNIALEAPAMMQKILLYLLGDLEQAAVYEDKVFVFYKYIFFVETVSKETSIGSAYRNINPFIIRDVVYTVAAVIRKDERGVLSTMACECFRRVAQAYVKEYSSILGKFLPAITTVLLPLAKQSDKALGILNLLICENYSKLESDIMFLDPFPPDEVFSRINRQMEKSQISTRNLKSTIQHFVKGGRSKNSGCRIEGLKNLRKMLGKGKDELREMYEELKMLRGFSEDCEKSLLHQLICMLVELTAEKNTVVKMEAANCLGELGPSDLTTLVLRPKNNFTTCKKTTTAIYRLIESAVNVLTDFIISDNYNVKKASSKALHAVLSTRQGRELLKNDAAVFNVDYLKPFSSSSSNKLELKINKEVFIKNLNDPEHWRPENHEKWIVNLLESLLRALSDPCGVIHAFRELILVNWQFAENIFPAVLDFVFSLNEEDCKEVVNRNVNEFFKRNFDYKDKSVTCLNKTSVQCMVNVVDYIRIQRSHEEMYQGFVLNINYLHVAKAALYCSAFFTSIFYAELWFEEKRKEDNSYMDINMICELYPEEGFALTEILRECHSKIGNSDGIHGCGYIHILNASSEIQHYEHLKNWNLSMLHHDIQLSQGNLSSKTGLLDSLERSGMFYTLNNLIKASNDLPDIASVQYKCAANLQDWSQVDSTYKTQNSLDHFDKCYYFALKAFHDEDDATFQNETHRARKSVLTELTHCSLESTKNLYLPISELQCLKELEEFALIVRGPDKRELEDLFRKWDGQDCIKCSEFKLIESILTNRTTMIKDRLDRTEDPEMKNYLQLMLCEVYYKLTVAARKGKKFETAIRTLSYLSKVQRIPEEIAGKAKLEKARILWERGDKEIGRFLLSHFLKKKEITGELRAKSLRIYGDWMAKTKSENSREIIENYYLKSISESNDSGNRLDSFSSLAKFADSNYEQLNEYLSSPLFEIKQNLISTQQDLASELRQELGWNKNREKRMAYQIAAKQSAIDENEIKNSKAERDSYLSLALKYYLLSLKEGEKCNLLVFRVISLWLSNASNLEVIQQLQKILHHIPTYKFLCLLPQLVPRMADVCLISDLVEQILQDHPHHTLPLIFALNNSYEDLKYNGIKTTVTTPRVLAAKSMLEKFQMNRKLERFIVEMRQFSNALIELANYNPPEKGKPGFPFRFPEHLRIRHIEDLVSVSVPSLHIPHTQNGNYENIIGVHRFEEVYHLVGGVNLPKRIKCIGSDGVSRTLLVKGKDDLRQDAVMQQVFTIMNSLLYQNSETNKRKLVIRTYKVVPLSQRSGVIEWCENTQPLSLYLTGPDAKSGAHKKFHPNDAVALDCRLMIREVFAQPQVTNEDKLKVFLEVCERIHPVFHHFFIEKFPAAGVWFERRLAYIHSVATSSMIGYILGIGDRHVHNILIDNATAEVIHIDLGIAFEQGKTLPTPETVPFRLTRDVVDGMGLSGIEGDFRISCVKTMEVLRDNQDTILTLLEVLLYDPFYTWTITPEKAYSMQNHTETSSSATEKSSPDLEINKMAERALIRLKQKLQGTEGGCVATNVEGQVNYLLQQARDPNNLCRLFHGWQAYL